MTMSWAVLLFLCSWWRWCRGSRLWTSLFLFSAASVLLLLLVSFGFSLLYTLTVPLVSNFSVFFPSFLSVLSSLVQTSLHPPPLFSFVNSLCLSPFFPLSRPLACWRCGGVFIGQKGAGASLLPPYSSAWGAGLCCPATAPGWLANGWGWQGAASLVSS